MRFFVFCFLCSALCLPAACDGPGAPLDADTRQRIDSISNTHIRLSKIELDSLCKLREKTELAGLVDSFKQLRMREIEEQMKTVPK